LLKFESSFLRGSNKLDYDEDIDFILFCMLSFIFRHLSKYKMYTWQKLIILDDFNICFYLKYISGKINDFYIRKIFSIIDFFNDKITIFLRNLDKGSI